jgi:hypothetical protein
MRIEGADENPHPRYRKKADVPETKFTAMYSEKAGKAR